jgi:hypothetical protein
MKTAGWSGTQRFTLAPDGLLVESRDLLTGAWSPSRQIFYDEILAVYTYRLPDWGYLPVALLYGILGLLVLGIAGVAGNANPVTWTLSLVLLALVTLTLAAYRVLVVQRSFVRLDTVTGLFTFASRQEQFVQQLTATLGARAPAAGAAPANAASANAPAAPAPSPPAPGLDMPAAPPAAASPPPESPAGEAVSEPAAAASSARGPVPPAPAPPASPLAGETEPAASAQPDPPPAAASPEDALASRWAWRPEGSPVKTEPSGEGHGSTGAPPASA